MRGRTELLQRTVWQNWCVFLSITPCKPVLVVTQNKIMNLENEQNMSPSRFVSLNEHKTNRVESVNGLILLLFSSEMMRHRGNCSYGYRRCNSSWEDLCDITGWLQFLSFSCCSFFADCKNKTWTRAVSKQHTWYQTVCAVEQVVRGYDSQPADRPTDPPDRTLGATSSSTVAMTPSL